ncbi:MAG TPA: tRNA preQ1(34) S-adenosylmethionine ribosyltransferase-isomerase QueA [Pirellulaceae bacterium]|nr:tRNA preQ1(34) S-adenosylmethionine ribosyltransferase-isomerase QueA [Pirellulaceae bacterium]
MISNESQNLVENYDFDLPRELIAQHPLANRADAKLMVVDRAMNRIEHQHVRDLPEILRRGDCIVQNDSRVILAKLNGFRVSTGGKWSGLFLEQDAQGLWRLLGRTKGKLQPGELIRLIDREGGQACELTLLKKFDDGSWMAKCSSDQSAYQVLDSVGSVPLPHYIRGGNMVDEDLGRYQTVYATQQGSIAAPTAGLHFTPSLIEQLRTLGIKLSRVTLHVGVGTFKPIDVDCIDEHRMHKEFGSISEEASAAINSAKQAGGRVIAVGTTSARVLETAAISGSVSAWQGATNLYIHPPYQFRAIDGLMTNFHLPRSTLLVLVRTFGGDELIRRAYALAIEQRYRFFSYGDAMLIV